MVDDRQSKGVQGPRSLHSWEWYRGEKYSVLLYAPSLRVVPISACIRVADGPSLGLLTKVVPCLGPGNSLRVCQVDSASANSQPKDKDKDKHEV